jgi:hypothetical protein
MHQTEIVTWRRWFVVAVAIVFQALVATLHG